MRCPSCAHDNRPDRRFCTECGATLAVACPSCGAPVEAGEKFCGGCGAALVDALVHADAPGHEIAAVVTEARELVRKSGGNSLLPRLRESEARLAGRDDRTILAAGLREAEAMYRAMGAPDPADRFAKELDNGR